MHRREIERLIGKTREKGLTLVPTRLYFRDGRVKVEIALAKGKDVGDKRQSIKEREMKREMERAIRAPLRRTSLHGTAVAESIPRPGATAISALQRRVGLAPARDEIDLRIEPAGGELGDQKREVAHAGADGTRARGRRAGRRGAARRGCRSRDVERVGSGEEAPKATTVPASRRG